MNNFEKQLEKWNNGILRGAQAKLAKCLQVTTATVALWATGKRRPSKGYVAQMARLFGITESGVQRLFMGVPPAALFTAPQRPGMLCDGPGPDIYTSEPYTGILTPTEKTVSLPVFTKVPPAYPMFKYTQVRAWWTVPKDAAKKAKFLVQLPSPTDKERLVFVQPCTEWKPGKNMLGVSGKTYGVFQVKRNGKDLILLTENGDKKSATRFAPVGIVTRQICNL